MCKLNKELQRTSFTIKNNLQNILDNPKVKAEIRTKRLMLSSWKQDIALAMTRLDGYDKYVMYMFGSMITQQHVDNLTSDELLALMLSVLKIMATAQPGDFNEEIT